MLPDGISRILCITHSVGGKELLLCFLKNADQCGKLNLESNLIYCSSEFASTIYSPWLWIEWHEKLCFGVPGY